MRTVIITLCLSISLLAQTPRDVPAGGLPTQPITPDQAAAMVIAAAGKGLPANEQKTVPILFEVHFLGAETIKAKYGKGLPKGIYAGSVTGINTTSSSVLLGQGFVLQVLRSNGMRALSLQDARAIVLQTQGSGLRGFWNKYSPIGVKILDDINNLQIFKVIQLPIAGAAALATADAVAKAVQPDVQTILQGIYQVYETDGIQSLMQIGPGGSIVGTLLFESEGGKPPSQPSPVIVVQVPVTQSSTATGSGSGGGK